MPLRIAGNRVSSRSGWNLREFLVRLTDQQSRLDELVELGLLVSATGQRAGLHDLVRLFAWEQLRADDAATTIEDATDRLCPGC
ncbi:hypothetical protein ACWEOE_40265 [Amycolatopsis sp. NPDC004368]